MNGKNIPLVPRVALVDLARQVDRLLKMQADYFRSRKPADLSACRDAERRLAETVKAIIERPESQPTLFADALSDRMAAVTHALVLDVAGELSIMADKLGRGHGDRHTAIRDVRVQIGRLRSSVPVSEGGAR
ncbi:hypothetical protein [Limnoglobus roseus]|uniref:Uncharacterized protein n=1 Tax=Limnoglobus roseus TaxID=2598579 RepID=A0A5C1AK07_9BACT|nr:hypothetical protein [Limnoglobus roseus]QEL18507.1 hypothetical protein PX52LOC_05533 [Limnoglobus roseus]